VPVTADDRAAVNPDLPDLAAWQFATVSIDHDDVRAGTGQPDTVDVSCGQLRRHDGRGRGGLGRTVGVDQLEARNLGRELLDGGDRHRRAAEASDPPGAQIMTIEI